MNIGDNTLRCRMVYDNNWRFLYRELVDLPIGSRLIEEARRASFAMVRLLF